VVTAVLVTSLADDEVFRCPRTRLAVGEVASLMCQSGRHALSGGCGLVDACTIEQILKVALPAPDPLPDQPLRVATPGTRAPDLSLCCCQAIALMSNDLR